MKTWWAALTDAALRAPVAPARRWLWPQRRGQQVFVIAIWASLAGAFTLGAIGEMEREIDSPAGLIAVLGVAQAAPLAIAAHRPLLAWRIMAVGMLGGVLVRLGDDVVMPWAVSSWI